MNAGIRSGLANKFQHFVCNNTGSGPGVGDGPVALHLCSVNQETGVGSVTRGVGARHHEVLEVGTFCRHLWGDHYVGLRV